MVTRFAIAAFLASFVGLCAGPAYGDGLVVDGTSVEASESDGNYTAKVSVLNAGPMAELPATVALTGPCTAEIDEPTVGRNRSADVTLTFDQSCFGERASLSADLDGGAGPLPKITITKPKDDTTWLPMVIGALIATAAALGIFVAGRWTIDEINQKRVLGSDSQEPSASGGFRGQARQLLHTILIPEAAEDAHETPEEREAAFADVKEQVDARVSYSDPRGPGLPWKLQLDPPGKYEWKSEVRGLEAGWSFKDSWAANLTVATTAFVALLNSADTLTAILGEKPEAALAVMTVAGLVSAIVIAIANTIAKLVGRDPAKVTAGGLIVSTSLVVFAAGLQTVTVGGTALALATEWPFQVLAVLLTAAVGVVLIAYARASMHTTLTKGAPESPLPAVPAEAFDAWAGERAWQNRIAIGRIRATYADWLDESEVEPSAHYYPRVPASMQSTGPGDDYPKRASLI